mmetsp:Transcript_76556/g.132460  ORF Transcript_76556/g.132460 Transcript_76556/m.132460 type:complete len:239 (+) Transcript_76556:278-994(+)
MTRYSLTRTPSIGPPLKVHPSPTQVASTFDPCKSNDRCSLSSCVFPSATCLMPSKLKVKNMVLLPSSNFASTNSSNFLRFKYLPCCHSLGSSLSLHLLPRHGSVQYPSSRRSQMGIFFALATKGSINAGADANAPRLVRSERELVAGGAELEALEDLAGVAEFEALGGLNAAAGLLRDRSSDASCCASSPSLAVRTWCAKPAQAKQAKRRAGTRIVGTMEQRCKQLRAQNAPETSHSA